MTMEAGSSVKPMAKSDLDQFSDEGGFVHGGSNYHGEVGPVRLIRHFPNYHGEVGFEQVAPKVSSWCNDIEGDAPSQIFWCMGFGLRQTPEFMH